MFVHVCVHLVYKCMYVCTYIRMCIVLQHCVHIPFKVCLVVLMLPALSTADDDITVDSTAMFPVLVYTFTLTTSSSVHCMPWSSVYAVAIT